MGQNDKKVVVNYNTEMELLFDLVTFMRERINLYPKSLQKELMNFCKLVGKHYRKYSELDIDGDIDDVHYYLIKDNDNENKIDIDYRYMEEKNLALLIDDYLSRVHYNKNVKDAIKKLEEEIWNNEEKNKDKLDIDENSNYRYLKETIFVDDLDEEEL